MSRSLRKITLSLSVSGLVSVVIYVFVVLATYIGLFPCHSLVGSELRLKTVLGPALTFLGAGLSILVFL